MDKNQTFEGLKKEHTRREPVRLRAALQSSNTEADFQRLRKFLEQFTEDPDHPDRGG